jgi:hypothetical protein
VVGFTRMQRPERTQRGRAGTQSTQSVQLVNASRARSLPGWPKAGKAGAQWIARLAEAGLRRPGFVPPPEIRALRRYTRRLLHLTQDRGPGHYARHAGAGRKIRGRIRQLEAPGLDVTVTPRKEAAHCHLQLARLNYGLSGRRIAAFSPSGSASEEANTPACNAR